MAAPQRARELYHTGPKPFLGKRLIDAFTSVLGCLYRRLVAPVDAPYLGKLLVIGPASVWGLRRVKTRHRGSSPTVREGSDGRDKALPNGRATPP